MNQAHADSDAAERLLTPGRWRVNTDRSSATFSARGFWGAAPVNGTFNELSGTATVEIDGHFQGELTIPTRTLSTRLALRDHHLKSAAFFHVKRHAEIRFDADGLTAGDEGPVVHGTLSVRDRRIELALPVQLNGEPGQRVALTAETSFDRAELGLGHSPLGMIRGPGTVRVEVILERDS